MLLYEDSNNKVGKHTTKNNYWKSKGIVVDRKHRLIVGDYMLDLQGKVSIDTKQDIKELATDFFCDSVRFEKECIRAKNNNIQLIFLVEEKVEERSKLLNWKCPKDINGKRFLNVSGKQIYNEMKKYVKLFGVKFRFCHKLSTGKTIIDLLLEETKRLEDNEKKI